MLQIRLLQQCPKIYKPNSKCRVVHCKKEILKKNYKQHLKKSHPAENSFDLTPFGQTKVSDLFKCPSKSSVENKQDEAEIVESGGGDENLETLRTAGRECMRVARALTLDLEDLLQR